MGAEKKIKKEALITYGKYDIAAITKQVTNGYGSMPAFGERLAPDDIEDVANYVRSGGQVVSNGIFSHLNITNHLQVRLWRAAVSALVARSGESPSRALKQCGRVSPV